MRLCYVPPIPSSPIEEEISELVEEIAAGPDGVANVHQATLPCLSSSVVF